MPRWKSTDSPTVKSSPSATPSTTPSATAPATSSASPSPSTSTPRRHQGPSRLRRRTRRGLARATAAKADALAAETAAQQDDDALAFSLPQPHHPDVPTHPAAAAQAGQVSAERADDDVPQQRDHDPVPHTPSCSCASRGPAS